MIIGVPKEIKNNENRVGMTPATAHAYNEHGHQVLVESKAGIGSGFSDAAYKDAGATLIDDRAEVWNQADMIVKVKEPLKEEFHYFHEGLILFTYLHLAAEPELTEALVNNKVTAIAYETIQLDNGSLPLLTPMSEVAGRMSVQIGAQFLEKPHEGKGVLLGGVPGVNAGRVVILGGGIVGTNAAKMALGLGAQVTILDINPGRLREIDDRFSGRIQTLISNPFNIAEAVKSADLVIGAVLIPGAKTPTLISEEMVEAMEAGSVLIDVAIDQGGAIETMDHITTHTEPTYTKHEVVHYAVANMPGAVPRTSTIALNNVTFPYGLNIANNGYEHAASTNKALAKGINVVNGHVVHEAVAKTHGFVYSPIIQALSTGSQSLIS
ncbi:alanine dehydrogenase [Tuberibacillus sp. Marseille-P3662]|uniref:alanine dehydrogenase n=1 Tax=Tuberibacillus sp. Marseille-P3662 TaxID=1965358 RepID=UPI000A1C9F36|nr:alanine dehydrogenase [Tuberibacillus sp. Marseille-P3662]